MVRIIVHVFCLGLAVVSALPAASADEPQPGIRDFGAGVSLRQATPLRDVIAAPERFAESPILLRGRLTDLCLKKGCWTVLADGDAFVRVRFRDYGFFLPPESLGRTALIQGVAEVRQLTEREARHIAAEARDGDPASIHGPQRELGFVATGVRLIDRSSDDAPVSEGRDDS